MASSKILKNYSPLLIFGSVSSSHGLKGFLFFQPYLELTDPAVRGCITSCSTANGHAYSIQSCTPHAHKFLLKLKGIDTREQADAFKGNTLFFTPGQMPSRGYFYQQLLGCSVVTKNNTVLGEVVSIYKIPAHINIGIKGHKEYDLPVVDSLIAQVDIERKIITTTFTRPEDFYAD